MRGIVAGIAFLAGYAILVVGVVLLQARFGGLLRDGVVGVDFFVVFFLPVFLLAAIGGALGVSLAGLSWGWRVRLGALFLVVLGVSLEAVLNTGSQSSYEVPDALMLAILLFWNLGLGVFFVRMGLKHSRIQDVA